MTMDSKTPEKEISKLHDLEPSTARVDALRARVFGAIEKNAPVPSPITVSPTPFTFARYSRTLASFGAAVCVLALFLANQAPMRGDYNNAIASLARAQRVSEQLEDSNYSSESVTAVRTATEETRIAFDNLKLKGVWGVYTHEQCLRAYILFDGYLDYLSDALDETIKITKDHSTSARLQSLKDYVATTKTEAGARINMYPQAQRDAQ